MYLSTAYNCYHPDTEIFTDRGWIPISKITTDSHVAALFDVGDPENRLRSGGPPTEEIVARMVQPSAVVSYPYSGQLYGLDASHSAYLVTPNHRIWRKGNSKACREWYCRDAQSVHGTNQRFMIAANFDREVEDPPTFELPEAHNARSGKAMDHVCSFPFNSWVKFMAFYLADGNVQHSNKVSHTIVITRKIPEKFISDTLDEMGLPFTRVNDQYIIGPNKPLSRYLRSFGKAFNKFVPREILQASTQVMRLFLDTIWKCDGDRNGGPNYYTISPRLRDDIERLLILTGHAVTLRQRDRRKEKRFCEGRPINSKYVLHEAHKLGYATVGTSKNWNTAYFKEFFHGNVYCPSVPGLGVVLTRFRGKTIWNGNSLLELND
ncbi:hypothetical protein G0Q06_01350 [Puniceicoccales bacterium CK1056]|uniref:DOD-type homing endonuclease domain-containing protein n=1 Tax=Oceanipulchritudo coccoides TaxID=2706888 RepID=A0A6B2LX14_9BACT|nr:hypothetical protein [Oceanipulchritudo coccoides]NDV61088.1 hypothetical protein [Oceanipulchritudo coccoides]